MFTSIQKHNLQHVFYSGVIESGIGSSVRSPDKTRRPLDIEQNAPTVLSGLHSLEVMMTSKKITEALKGKFDIQKIAFNMVEFEKILQESLMMVMDNPDIPFIAKRKFLEDVNSKIGLLASITPADIDTLRTQRNILSGGIEAYELSEKTEREKQAFYLNKILAETIGKYIIPTALGLVEAFGTDKNIMQDGSTFHKETFEKTRISLGKLDQKYGFDFASQTTKFLGNSNNDARTKFLEEIQKGLLSKHPNGAWLSQMIKNGNITESIRKGADIDYKGKKINIIEAYQAYAPIIKGGQKTEAEARDARDIALADGTIAKIKNGLGMDQLKSEFDHLTPENIEAKMKHASIADMIILIIQFATIAPVVGDIGGGVLDVTGAVTGVSVDGAMMSRAERAISGVFGGLGIMVVGGWINRARNAGKLTGLAKVLPLIQKYLPEKIETLVKRGGKMSEKIKLSLIGSSKILGEDIGRRIEGLIVKHGLQYNFMEDSLDGKKISRNISPKDKKVDIGNPITHQNKKEELIKRADAFVKLPEVVEKRLESADLTGMSTKQLADFSDNFVRNISEKLPKCTPKQLEIVQQQIVRYIHQKQSVQIYFNKYQNNPSEFVKLAFGVTPKKEVEIKVVGANLVLYSDFSDFNLIKSRGANDIPLFAGEGVNFKGINLPGIENAISMIPGRIDHIESHELMHGRNFFTMPERIQESTRYNAITRGKDEIIAFIRSGILFPEIQTSLLSDTYDYFAEIKHLPEYASLRKEYIQKITKYIKIAEDLFKEGASLDELAVTPIEKWARLGRHKKLEIIKEMIGKKYPDGSYEGRREFINGTIFEGVFSAGGDLLVGIKKYSYFSEEGTFSPIFDRTPSVSIMRSSSNSLREGSIFDIKKCLKNYERDYRMNEMLSLIKH